LKRQNLNVAGSVWLRLFKDSTGTTDLKCIKNILRGIGQCIWDNAWDD
jgi:hypothetical protein